MFELVRPVAPPTMMVADADLDRIEQVFACRLPADYRTFMKTFGPGNLNTYIEFRNPDRVIEETIEMRGIYKDEGVDPPWHVFLFDCFDNAAEYFTPDDIDRFVVFGSSSIGDVYLILPDDPPRYFELPRDGFTVGDGGTTMDSFLVHLDPRTRYRPQASRIVENGVVREDDGRPNDTPYVHTFTPEGYPPPDERTWVDQEITWGHSDDPFVTSSLAYGYDELPSTTIELIHAYTARYPLFALLDAIAQGDPTTRFSMRAQDIAEAELSVPRYEATLGAARGQHGLTLYARVPSEHADALFRWLVAAIRTIGSEVPQALLALVP